MEAAHAQQGHRNDVPRTPQEIKIRFTAEMPSALRKQWKVIFGLSSRAKRGICSLPAKCRSLAALGMTSSGIVFLGALGVSAVNSYPFAPQHFLYFLPLPHGQGSLRPT